MLHRQACQIHVHTKARLTRRAVVRLALALGKPVWVQIKAMAVID
jgi:ABC-type molybdate transport system ATPase subunit